RTAPGGEKDVHIARTALFFEGGLTAGCGDRASERASERTRSRGAHRLFPALRAHDDARVTVAPRKACRGALQVTGVDARWHAITDAELRLFDDSIADPCGDALETAVEPIERAGSVGVTIRRSPHSLPERQRFFRDRRSRRRAVTRFARKSDVDREPSFVRDRYGIPPRRLADHAPVRSCMRRAIASPSARRRLLLDGADNRDADARDGLGRGGHECGERTL